VLVRARHRVAAGFGYLLFAVAPFWYTPHSGGPREYGWHWLLTVVANCYLIAGLAFLAYMTWDAWLGAQRSQGQTEDLGAAGRIQGAAVEFERGPGGTLDPEGGVGTDDSGAVRTRPS
ncbi:MAG: hypothetical protein ACHP9Z_26085, partial [Streptosporangiales bacterium]